MEASLDAIFDAQTPRVAQEITALLVHLVQEGILPAGDFLDTITSTAATLEDLRWAGKLVWS